MVSLNSKRMTERRKVKTIEIERANPLATLSAYLMARAAERRSANLLREFRRYNSPMRRPPTV
jgi:hypothetical protein